MTRGSEPGYRRERKVYNLTYADHPGLKVKAKSVSTEQFLRITELSDAKDFTPEIAKELLANFAEVLVSWNLEAEDGTPVPCTAAGLLGEDFDFVMEILNGWMDAVAGVSAPLAQPSTGGSPSPVESIPMDVLSPPPLSWSEPVSL
jgi:hypothetical protein